jgi:hypothetical protein
MPNAGQYGVNIGQGAASGAGLGASFGPWGAVIGGGVGALGGALSTLLSSSDEAKQRKKALEAYRQQTREQREKYIAQSYEPYNVESFPSLAAEEEDFNARMPVEQAPNYGQLAQSAMSLGSTVGGLSRQSAAQSKLDELIQSRKNGAAQAQGMPWGGYASDPWSMY